LNGYAFRPNEAEAVHVVLDAAAGQMPEDVLATWIGENTIRKP